ncbi:unnamed protein product, partial [Polarella glacialis]
LLLGISRALHYLKSTSQPKLTDFGLARVLNGRVKARGNTPRWSPPEMVAKKVTQPTPAADVFSFARIAFFVVTGVLPLQHLDVAAIREKLKKADVPDEKWPGPGEEVPFISYCLFISLFVCLCVCLFVCLCMCCCCCGCCCKVPLQAECIRLSARCLRTDPLERPQIQAGGGTHRRELHSCVSVHPHFCASCAVCWWRQSYTHMSMYVCM